MTDTTTITTSGDSKNATNVLHSALVRHLALLGVTLVEDEQLDHRTVERATSVRFATYELDQSHLKALTESAKDGVDPHEDDLDRMSRTFDGKTAEQREGTAWKIVGTDNYNRETVADYVLAENVRNEGLAKKIARILNDGTGNDTWYVAVPHDCRLSAGMLDLV